MKEAPARSWACLVRSHGCGSGGVEWGPWYQLAIYESGSGQGYLVSIRFHSHPSKEPFQAYQECKDHFAVAAFLITHDPRTILRRCGLLSLNKAELQKAYQLQVHALLSTFEKQVSSQ
jgi:hypothetical protein